MHPDPRKDDFWRKRILTEEELAELSAICEEIDAKRKALLENFKTCREALLKSMLDAGFRRDAPEYRYVANRVKASWLLASLRHSINTAQDDLQRKAGEDEKKRQQAEANAQRRKEGLAKLTAEAQSFGIDPVAYFGDEDGLMQAVTTAKRDKFEKALETAPYYVLASFYGHCLRGDWSYGRDSYGFDELRDLAIPSEDPDYPDLHLLAVELQGIANEWDGEDGRDFRDAYTQLDALLSLKDATLLKFLDAWHYKDNYL